MYLQVVLVNADEDDDNLADNKEVGVTEEKEKTTNKQKPANKMSKASCWYHEKQ